MRTFSRSTYTLYDKYYLIGLLTAVLTTFFLLLGLVGNSYRGHILYEKYLSSASHKRISNR